jgi:hypothetical protein
MQDRRVRSSPGAQSGGGLPVDLLLADIADFGSAGEAKDILKVRRLARLVPVAIISVTVARLRLPVCRGTAPCGGPGMRLRVQRPERRGRSRWPLGTSLIDIARRRLRPLGFPASFCSFSSFSASRAHALRGLSNVRRILGALLSRQLNRTGGLVSRNLASPGMAMISAATRASSAAVQAPYRRVWLTPAAKQGLRRHDDRRQQQTGGT